MTVDQAVLRLPALQEQRDEAVWSFPPALSTATAAIAAVRPQAGSVSTTDVAKVDSGRALPCEPPPAEQRAAQSRIEDSVEWEVMVPGHVSPPVDQRDMGSPVCGGAWIRYPARVAHVIERAYQRKKAHTDVEDSVVQVFFSSA
jgi:hypothetical protein